MQHPYFNAFSQQIQDMLAALAQRRQWLELWQKAEDGGLPDGLSEPMLEHLLQLLLHPETANQELGKALLEGVGLDAANLLEYFLAIQIPLAAYAGQPRPYPETWEETEGLAVFYRRLTNEFYLMEWLDPQVVVLQLVRLTKSPETDEKLEEILGNGHFLSGKNIQLLHRRFFYRSLTPAQVKPKEAVWRAYHHWLHRALRHLPTGGLEFAEYHLGQMLESVYLKELYNTQFVAHSILCFLGLWGWKPNQQDKLVWLHEHANTPLNRTIPQIHLPSFSRKLDENLYSINSIYFDWPPNWQNLGKMPQLSQLLVLSLGLEQLAKGFYALDKLKHIHLQGLKLGELDEEMGKFKQLKTLTLSNLTCERLPKSLLGLPLLSLTLNQLKGLSPEQHWEFATEIEELILERLTWRELPGGLSQLKGLKKLHLKQMMALNWERSRAVILQIPQLESLVIQELNDLLELPPRDFWAKHPSLQRVVVTHKNRAEIYWSV